MQEPLKEMASVLMTQVESSPELRSALGEHNHGSSQLPGRALALDNILAVFG